MTIDDDAGPDELGGAVTEADRAAARAVDYEKIVRSLLFHLELHHSFPWRIERDWTYEVTASDGFIIDKCGTLEDAQAVIDLAEQVKNKYAVEKRNDVPEGETEEDSEAMPSPL